MPSFGDAFKILVVLLRAVGVTSNELPTQLLDRLLCFLEGMVGRARGFILYSCHIVIADKLFDQINYKI